MKIVKKGKPAKAIPAWWEGKEFTCSFCKSVIKLEAADSFSATFVITNEEWSKGKQEIAFMCPLDGCNEQISFQRPREEPDCPSAVLI